MKRVDALIVGGGIAGSSLAARLAPSMSVLVAEAEEFPGMHATGRSVAFWHASLGGDTPERRLSLISKPMFDARWPDGETESLRTRGAVHLLESENDRLPEAEGLSGDYAVKRLDRTALTRLVPGLRERWAGAIYEPTCADIDVAAFQAACIKETKKAGGEIRCSAPLRAARRVGSAWMTRVGDEEISSSIIVNAAGAWGDEVARMCGVRPLGLVPKRRTIVQLRIGRRGLRDMPFVTDRHDSFYFKGEADNVVWVCPLDETAVAPCDAAPEELDVATAIDRFERAVDWPVEAVERKWAGLRTFAPDRGFKFGFDSKHPAFFWCVGQGGMGIQTAPAASLACARVICGEEFGVELADVSPADFQL